MIGDKPIKSGSYSQLGYRSARKASSEGRSPTSSSGSAHQANDKERLVSQSREFMRDNSIYNGMIDKAVSYIIGNGYTLQAQTRSKSWNRRIEAQFKRFWANPEVKEILSGFECEAMICRELLVAGDVGAIKTNKGKFQIIESEQLTSSEYKDGIQKDSYGKPLSFYVSPWAKGRVDKTQASPYPEKDFIFVSDPDRPSSIRSVPPCQSAFPNIHRINDICDSEALAWQMLSRMALQVNREDASKKAYDISGDDTSSNSTGNNADISSRITELDYALIFHGEVGEEIKSIDRNLPGKDFPQSIKMFLRLLGLPLGLPLEITLLDWNETSFSGSRAVLEQAFTMFRRRQMLIEKKFHRNIFQWFVQNQVDNGLIADRSDKFLHTWIHPTFPWIDQLKDSQAWATKLDRSFTTQNKAIKSLGDDPDDVLEGRATEIVNAIDRANAINEKYKLIEGFIPVDWRTFAGLKVEGNSNAGKPLGAMAEPKKPEEANT